MPFGLDSRQLVSIARQPLLDPKSRVFGYQLLYDCGPSPLEAADTAAARTLSEAVLSIGIDALSCGHPLFITLTRPLLLGGAGSLVPPSSVFALDDSIQADAEVVAMCKNCARLATAWRCASRGRPPAIRTCCRWRSTRESTSDAPRRWTGTVSPLS